MSVEVIKRCRAVICNIVQSTKAITLATQQLDDVEFIEWVVANPNHIAFAFAQPCMHDTKLLLLYRLADITENRRKYVADRLAVQDGRTPAV
jgi:hypothetical protein